KVTADMLRAEMERQARGTRMPERLRELYAALGDDPFLIAECLARPILVDRLSRSFFAHDGRIHEAARKQAEALGAELQAAGPGVFARDPRRSETEIVRDEPNTERGVAEPKQGRELRLSAEEFAKARRRAPETVGSIGAVREERDAF